MINTTPPTAMVSPTGASIQRPKPLLSPEFNKPGVINTIRSLGIDPASEIGRALGILSDTNNKPEDEVYLRSLGINIIFHSGQQALDLIRQRGSRVVFGDMGDSKAHAQFNSEQNTLMINARYRGDFSKPTLYAIAAAIYHEAGHLAGSGDNQSSLQEEIDCLALNTLAYRTHIAKDPVYGQFVSTSRLLSDGVALYPKLFFDPDPNKEALLLRIIEKYGDLPLSSPDHPVPFLSAGQPPLAVRVWNLKRLENTQALLAQTHRELGLVIRPNQLTPTLNQTPFVPDMQFRWYYPDQTAQATSPTLQINA